MNIRRPIPRRRGKDWGAIGVVAYFLFVIVISLAWLGFIVWAIYSVVTWLTSK